MSNNRNLGDTESRLGLTIFSCLLIGVGLHVLQRLDDSASTAPASNAPGSSNFDGHARTAEQHQILTGKGTVPSTLPRAQTSLRPIWIAPQSDSNEVRLQSTDPSQPRSNVGQPRRLGEVAEPYSPE